MHPFARAALLAACTALVLSACTVTFDPASAGEPRARDARPEPSGIVVRPQPPAAGDDADLPSDDAFAGFSVDPNNIKPETVLTFRMRLRQEGYLTVSVMSPEGRVQVLVRNERVPAGRQVLVPATDTPPRDQIRASGPAGTWRVRAQLSPQRTSARYGGVQGLDAWNAAIARDLAGIDGASVVETYYDVQRR